MMEKCANTMTTWLIQSGVVEEEDRELYEYAAYSLLITISPLLLSVIFGIVMGRLIQSIILIIPFMVIRKFSGGYHAKQAFVCFIWSSLLLILCIYLSSCIKCNLLLGIVTIWALISLIVFSPIDSENRRLSQKEKKKYKTISSILAIIFCYFSVIFYLLKLETYAVCFSIGIILSASLQIPCIYQRIRKME